MAVDAPRPCRDGGGYLGTHKPTFLPFFFCCFVLDFFFFPLICSRVRDRAPLILSPVTF